MTVDQKKRKADPVTCPHIWDVDAEPVVVVRPGLGRNLVAEQYEAFPCRLCPTLLVMNARSG